MNKIFKLEKNSWFYLSILGLIMSAYIYLSYDGYKLFNSANTSKYDPKKEHHYHK